MIIFTMRLHYPYAVTVLFTVHTSHTLTDSRSEELRGRLFDNVAAIT